MLLCGSFATESITLVMAVQNIRRKAKQAKQTPYEYGKIVVIFLSSALSNTRFGLGLFCNATNLKCF